MGFAPQPALYCNLPVQSAFTEYQRNSALGGYRAAPGEVIEDIAGASSSQNAKKSQEYFTSTSGPYILNNGKLSQQQAY